MYTYRSRECHAILASFLISYIKYFMRIFYINISYIYVKERGREKRKTYFYKNILCKICLLLFSKCINFFMDITSFIIILTPVTNNIAF